MTETRSFWFTLASVAITPQHTLRRQLGVLAVTTLVIGEVIAIGIFLTPAGMARSLGSPFWLLIVWLLMGVMALSGALCYGELAARTPEAGGGYVYLREAYGRGVAFLYGWKCMLVMDPGITAALAVGLASYVGYALGLVGATLKLIAIGTILLLAAVNVVGLRLGSGLMQWLTALKLGALGLIAVLALVMRAGQWSNFVPFVAQRAGSDPVPGALAPALVGAFFAFGGWWEISKLAREARACPRDRDPDGDRVALRGVRHVQRDHHLLRLRDGAVCWLNRGRTVPYPAPHARRLLQHLGVSSHPNSLPRPGRSAAPVARRAQSNAGGPRRRDRRPRRAGVSSRFSSTVYFEQ